MANIPMKDIQFPGLDDTYTFAQVDATLTTQGKAADAKKTGDEISELKADYNYLNGALDASIFENISEDAIWEIGTEDRTQDWAGGGMTNNSNANVTKFVDVSAYKFIRYMAFCSTASVTSAGIAFFSEKSGSTYISGVKAYENASALTMEEQQALVPSGAKYARFTVLKDYSGFYIKGYSTVEEQIEDKVEKKAKEITELTVEYKPVLWAVGTIASNGAPATSSTRVRSTTIYARKGDQIRCEQGVKFNPIYYNEYNANASTYVKSGKTGGTDSLDYTVDTDGWIRIIAGNVNDSTITDAYAIGNKIHYYKKDDYIVDMTGKTVAILGASIDTHGNTGMQFPNAVEITVTPEDVGVELSAYLTIHDVVSGLSLGGHTFTEDEAGTEVTFTPTQDDIGKVIGLPADYNGQTMNVWWCAAMPFFGYTPIPVCWSGSSITSHEKNISTKKCSWGWHPSQIRKCGIRTPGTMQRTAPDYIIITRVANDYSHTPYAVLDNNYFDTIPFYYPENDSDNQGVYHYMWGYAMTIKALREAYPNSIIILSNETAMRRVDGSTGDIPNNGTNTLAQFNNAVEKIGAFFGCSVIDTSSCGITLENISQTTGDNDTHPNQKGQYLKANKFIAEFSKIVSCRY